MISIVCFIIPMILYILTFPLKAIVVALEARDKIEAMRERGKGKGSLLSRIENWADEDDGQLEQAMLNGTKRTAKLGKDAVVGSAKLAKNSVKYSYKAGKFAYKTGKRTVKATKFAIKATKATVKAIRVAIKATIALIKFIILLIKSIVAFLVALGTIGIIILIVVCLALICILVVTVCIPKITEVQADASTGSGGFSGYDYLSIDWSKDFSAKLSEIESTYGAKNRHHAELVILNMRTLQENKNLNIDPSTWVGIKRVESGNTVFESDSSSVFSNYSTVYPNDNGYSCFGPFQINLKDSAHSWTLSNSKYTPSDTPPNAMSSRDGTYGNIFFYPDLCLGTNTAYSDFLNSWTSNNGSGSRGYSGMIDDLKQCFQDLGVAYDDKKGRKVLEFMCANAYNEGSIRSLKNNPHNTIAKLYIEFFNTYGWERNDLHVKLIKSMINASSGGENKNIYVTADPQTSWLWGSNASKFNTSINMGVLDKNGTAISKSLYGYLADGNSTLQSGIGTFPTDNSSINSARTYYGIAVYVVGTWEIEKTIDYLDLRSQLKTSGGSGSGGNIVDIALREGNSQPPNRITYQQGTAVAYKADCSQFVARVLTEAGYNAFGITASNHAGFKAHDDFSSCVSEAGNNGGGTWTTPEQDWIRANQPQAIIYDGSGGGLDTSKLQPGDICYEGDSRNGTDHHVTIYMGKNANGVDYICHASSATSFTCTDDPDDLDKSPKYGFGFGKWEGYHHNGTNLVFRPSLIK